MAFSSLSLSFSLLEYSGRRSTLKHVCAVGSLSRKTENKTVRNQSNNNRLPASHGISSDNTGSLSASIYITGGRERHCENLVSYRRAQNGGAVKAPTLVASGTQF